MLGTKSIESSKMISESLRLEGISWDHLVQPPDYHSVSYSMLSRTMSSQLLRFSIGGDSTVCMGDLFQCLTNLTVEKVFSCVEVKFCVFICSSCLLTCHLGTTEKSLSPSYSLPPAVQNIGKIPLSHLLQAEQSSSLSLSSDQTCSRVPLWSLWPFAGLTPVSLHFS